MAGYFTQAFQGIPPDFIQTILRAHFMPGPGPTLVQLAQNVGEGVKTSEHVCAADICANQFFLTAPCWELWQL